jgi:hypothetical protein
MHIPAALVITDNKIILQPCALYKGHSCAVINAHHICPKSWFEAAGVPVQTPMINLCPTCHFNVHAAIDGTIKGEDVSGIGRNCRSLAAQAFALATVHHLTPGPTL